MTNKSPKADILGPDRSTKGDSLMATGGRLPSVPVPDVLLGSTFLGRVKWKSMGSMIAAYRRAIEEAAGAKRALGDLQAAELEFQRGVELLEDAESVHTHDKAVRSRARDDAIDAAEESAMRLEERRAERARRRASLESGASGNSTGGNTSAHQAGDAAARETQAAFEALRQPKAMRMEVEAEIARTLAGRAEGDATPAEKALFQQLREGVEQMIRDRGLE